MNRSLCYIALSIVVLACEDVVLGPAPANDPANNFEILWEDFDQHYSLFNVRGIDWQALKTTYEPMVSGNTTDEELWTVFTSLIENLDDGHTIIYDNNERRKHQSGFSKGTIATEEEFSLGLISSKYVHDFKTLESEEDFRYAAIRTRNIGYILLRKEEGDDPEGALSQVFDFFAPVEAIILDLRTNRGGSSRYTKVISGGFSDGENLIGTMQTRNGPGYSDFDAPTEIISQITGEVQFLKPVVVLTDRATVSAGEHLTLQLKSFDHVTHMGDTTAGDLSTQSRRRFLPNGWSYNYSIGLFLLPDGSSIDGIGVAPDIYVKNTAEDIEAGNDVVLNRALQFLRDEYGI